MNPVLEHLPQRLLGLALLLAAMVAYEPGGNPLLHGLLIPVVMAAAAAMLVQNLAAVALGALLLATIHSNLASQAWLEARAYPALALLAAVILLAVLGRRFRRRIRETREARWAPRRRAATGSATGTAERGQNAANGGARGNDKP